MKQLRQVRQVRRVRHVRQVRQLRQVIQVRQLRQDRLTGTDVTSELLRANNNSYFSKSAQWGSVQVFVRQERQGSHVRQTRQLRLVKRLKCTTIKTDLQKPMFSQVFFKSSKTIEII